MGEGKQKAARQAKSILDSRFWKVFLIILAAFLTFAGPTYAIYVFLYILDINYFVSFGSGFVLFVVGLVLLWYLIRKKSIS